MTPDRIIRTIRRYTGVEYPWLQGERVVVVSVRRGDTVLHDDESIGTLSASDRIDFAPVLEEDDGVERAVWQCVDAPQHELGAPEGEWAGSMPDGTGYWIRSVLPHDA